MWKITIKFGYIFLINKSICSIAYTSWVRFYSGYPREVRPYLDAKQLHLGHAAKAFALRETPAALVRRAKGNPGLKQERPSNRLTVHEEEEKKRPGWVLTQKIISSWLELFEFRIIVEQLTVGTCTGEMYYIVNVVYKNNKKILECFADNKSCFFLFTGLVKK